MGKENIIEGYSSNINNDTNTDNDNNNDTKTTNNLISSLYNIKISDRFVNLINIFAVIFIIVYFYLYYFKKYTK